MATSVVNKGTISVQSPVDGSLLANIPTSTDDALNEQITQAEFAFQAWKNRTLKDRVQVLYTYRNLLIKHTDELTQLIQSENGKIESEARAEVEKAIEVTEFACSLPQIIPNEIQEVSRGVDCQIRLEPLGVVANITPFNFPVMVPHWTLPIALGLGNAVILKPSEKVPLSPIRFTELLYEAGLPENLVQLVQGGKESVDALCAHPSIKAVSFVGSTDIARKVYQNATQHLKPALCLGGAKNHLIVLPDADPEMTSSDIVASMSGCAGQRCMAASAMVAVGEQDTIISAIVEKAKQLVPGDNIGAIITKESKDRIERYINQAEKDGAKILVDGRNTTVKGRENGYYVGPTVIDNVTPDMSVAREEIFGPVLSIMRCKTAEEAIEIENSSEYGNGASVYTSNGGSASALSKKLQAGMIGVNIGVPVPREPFSFGGWHDSKFGTGDITGKSSIHFWTKPKKITMKWSAKDKSGWMS